MHVDHIQEHEPAAVGGCIELEVHGPHLMWVLSPVTTHRAIGGSHSLAPPMGEPLQALLMPKSWTRLCVMVQLYRLSRR